MQSEIDECAAVHGVVFLVDMLAGRCNSKGKEGKGMCISCGAHSAASQSASCSLTTIQRLPLAAHKLAVELRLAKFAVDLIVQIAHPLF